MKNVQLVDQEISLCSVCSPGAVERTGGICPFERKLRSWDCFTGENLTDEKTSYILNINHAYA